MEAREQLIDKQGYHRWHPDLFTDEQAAEYLHLDSLRGLETLRTRFGLVGFPGVNRSLMYWREDLDAVARKIAGRDKTEQNIASNGKLRIAGNR